MNPFVIAFRRIIYSIPLKRLLLLLAVFCVLFVCFSSADNYELPQQNWEGNILYNGLWDYTRDSITFDSSDNVVSISNSVDFVCFRSWSSNPDYSLNYSVDNGYTWYRVFSREIGCTDSKTIYFKDGTVDFFYFIKGDGFVDSDYTSMQCQTEYNLIPISSVDQNYCTTNNLCPSGGSPSDCPNVGVSNLYINDIFHPGAFNVIMNIPEEIDWDYAYTNSGQNFNIDVVGYNQDFEKIEGWIETNNYKPTSDDFTNIFKNFSNFGGLLVGALFVILVFYFVKKMFK